MNQPTQLELTLFKPEVLRTLPPSDTLLALISEVQTGRLSGFQLPLPPTPR